MNYHFNIDSSRTENIPPNNILTLYLNFKDYLTGEKENVKINKTKTYYRHLKELNPHLLNPMVSSPPGLMGKAVLIHIGSL